MWRRGAPVLDRKTIWLTEAGRDPTSSWLQMLASWPSRIVRANARLSKTLPPKLQIWKEAPDSDVTFSQHKLEPTIKYCGASARSSSRCGSNSTINIDGCCSHYRTAEPGEMGMTLEISGEIEDLRETIQDLRFQMVENAKAAEAYVAAAPHPRSNAFAKELFSCSADRAGSKCADPVGRVVQKSFRTGGEVHAPAARILTTRGLLL
jgi:hypothetical protein